MDNTEAVKRSYAELRINLKNCNPYTEKKTIQKLKSETLYYKKWFGKSGNRKLIVEDLRLYKSVLYHTQNYPHSINFRGRLILLCEHDNNLDNIRCKCGDILKYNANGKKFVMACLNCKPRSNSLEFFIQRYGKDGREKFKQMKQRVQEKSKGFMSKEWFVKKYGYTEGKQRYTEHYEKIFKTREENGIYSYSKISQELFWSILNKLSEEEKAENDIRFYTFDNRHEQRINLNKKDKEILGDLNRVTMFVDFKWNNKIIEFDGSYWHKGREEHDLKRDRVLVTKGYQILHVKENNFKTNPADVVENCVNFLRS